jgi:hypothetical protein
MLFLSDSPYFKLLFYIVFTIIKTFIIVGHQFLYPLLVEPGRLWRQQLLYCLCDAIISEETVANKKLLEAQEQMKVTWH